jgi:hypothetical protein
MIRSVHINSCLAAQIRFMLFKGPGSFKKVFKIGGNVDELKAHRLIQLTHPLFFHFTLPLNTKPQFPFFKDHNTVELQYAAWTDKTYMESSLSILECEARDYGIDYQ